MTSILDIAREDGVKAAGKSIAMRMAKTDHERKQVTEQFIQRRFAELYREMIYRERNRMPSARECFYALQDMRAKEPVTEAA